MANFRRVYIVSAYLFLLLFIAVYFKNIAPEINQAILWIGGPLTAAVILIPRISGLARLPQEIYLYGSLILIALFGYPLVENVPDFLRYLQVLVANLVLLLIIYFSIRSLNEIVLIIKVVWFSCLLILLFSFFGPVENVDTASEYYRMTGILDNANGLANVGRVCIVLALLLLQFTSKRCFKLLLLASILLSSYATILSASRSNFAILLLIFITYLFWVQLKGIKVIVFGLLVSMVLYFSFTYITSSLEQFYLYDRLTRNESISEATESEGRLLIYLDALQVYSKNPILGVGLNQYKHKGSFGKISHTDLLDIAVQLGTFALIFYTLIYIRLFKRIRTLEPIYDMLNLLKINRIILIIFFSELLFGLVNPNWFSQLQIIVLGILIVLNYRVIPTEITYATTSSQWKNSIG